MITAAITRNTRQMMERERGNTGVKTGIPADIYEAIGQRKTDLQAMKPGWVLYLHVFAWIYCDICIAKSRVVC